MTAERGPTLDELAAQAEHRTELRAAADRVLADAWSTDAAIAALDAPEAWPTKLWGTIADLGWPDVLSTDGGGTIGDLCVLLEAAGAAAAPVPLGTCGVAAFAESRDAEHVTVVADGAPVPVGADGAPVRATWPFVEYGQVARRVLLPISLADGSAGVGAVDLDHPSVEVRAVRPLDRGPAATIALHDAPVEVLAVDAGAVQQRLLVARAAELVGVASGANAAAAAYAKERTTFGKPIGTYQAIKHRLVDQRVAVEVARALVARAADAVERGSGDAAGVTALAAFWATDALRRVPEGAIQVFGGIGYTWEHPAHLFLRRAAVLTALLGPAARHRPAAIAWLTSTSR